MNGSSGNKIVVITASPNDAESIGSHLRNAGHAVHTDWLQDTEELGSHLHEAVLVFCADPPPKSKLKDVISQCHAIVPGLPVLAMGDAVDVTRATKCMRIGAHDLVSLQHLDHLLSVAVRELEFGRLYRALKDSQQKLMQVEHRHDTLLQDSSEALAYVQEGILIRTNPSYAKLFGFTDAKEIEGLPLMDMVVIDDRPKLKQNLRQVAKGGGAKEAFVYQGRHADGSSFAVNMRFSRSQIDDEDCIEVLAAPETVAQDVESTIPASAPAPAAESAAYTGQHGRQALYTALDAALQDSHQQPNILAAALFLRVDNLERLEQRLGFNSADQVCNELAAFLLQLCGTSDRAFRFSGGEFVVLAARSELAGVESAVNDIRKAVSGQTFGGEKHSTALTVSIAAMSLAWHSDAQELLREARQQVSAIQAKSGSGVYIETAQEKEKAGTTQQVEKVWLARIRAAMEQNRFKLAYKNIVSLEGEASQYFDVLLRMLNEKGEELPSMDFVPVAEKHGLMPAIDQWVLQQVVQMMISRRMPDQNSGLFVRISDASLAGGEKLVPWLIKQIKAYPIRPDGLLLMFNEQGLQDHLAKAKTLLADLKKFKIRIAISHFGATQQSLQLLEQMPADFLRLDEAMIKALSNPKTSDRVSQMLGKARDKGVRIVAKQVTDAQTMAILWSLGVHFIEGDFVEEPAFALQQTA